MTFGEIDSTEGLGRPGTPTQPRDRFTPPPRWYSRFLPRSRRRRAQLRRAIIYLVTLVILGYLAITIDWSRLRETMFDPEIAGDQFPEVITQAAKNTLVFTFWGFTGGLAIGLLLALMRLSTIRPYRWFAVLYIELFRSIPALLTIVLIGFGVPIALGNPFPGGVRAAGSVALALVAGAYMAETFRAGIQAVPKGQLEAARSLGMSQARAMATIVIPQALRIILPPLTNELVLLIKDTALLSVLGVTEDTREILDFVSDAQSDTLNATPLIVGALVYLVITIPLTQAAALLERRGQRAR